MLVDVVAEVEPPPPLQEVMNNNNANTAALRVMGIKFK